MAFFDNTSVLFKLMPRSFSTAFFDKSSVLLKLMPRRFSMAFFDNKSSDIMTSFSINAFVLCGAVILAVALPKRAFDTGR